MHAFSFQRSHLPLALHTHPPVSMTLFISQLATSEHFPAIPPHLLPHPSLRPTPTPPLPFGHPHSTQPSCLLTPLPSPLHSPPPLYPSPLSLPAPLSPALHTHNRPSHGCCAVLMYKLIAAYRLLRREPSTPVLVLDATSLVSSRACFDELLSYPEDVVISSEPKRGCPVSASFNLGAVGNTGVMLLRPAALGFLRGVLVNQRGKYRHHCYEQEAFNNELVDANFSWTRFPLTGSLPGRRPSRAISKATLARYRGINLRFLNFSHWPRSFAQRRKHSHADSIWYAENPRTGCLFHPWITNKSAHADTYARNGLWYF